MLIKVIINLSLFVLLITFTNCSNTKESNNDLQPNEIAVLDSITIGKLISSQQELTAFNLLNDTTIIGFDHFSQVNFYVKKNGVFNYKKTIALSPEHSNTAFLSINKNKFYVLAEKTIYTYDSTFNLIDSLKITSQLKHLKGDFFLACSNFLPLLQFGDTLVSYFSNSNPKDFFVNFKEPAFMEVSLNKNNKSDTAILPKPQDLEYYDVNFYSFHAAINNIVYKLYNGLDTLYGYDRLTKKEQKIAINNKDYKTPVREKTKDLFDFQYLTKRGLSNFSYNGMFYNPNTNHLVLFYTLPVNRKSDKNPTVRDQKLQAIVLDQNLKIIKYVNFKDEYLPTMTFFPYGDQGVAMPLFNEDPSSEPTKFHIYNF